MNEMIGMSGQPRIMNKEWTLMFEPVKLGEHLYWKVYMTSSHKLYRVHDSFEGGFVESPECICSDSFISKNVSVRGKDTRIKNSVILTATEFVISESTLENCNISTNSGYITTSKVSNLNCSNGVEFKIWMNCDLKGSYDFVNTRYVNILNTVADCDLVTTEDFCKITFDECKFSGRVLIDRNNLMLERCNVVGPYKFSGCMDEFITEKLITE